MPNEKSGIYYFINLLVLLMNAALFLLLAVQQDTGLIRNLSFAGGFISIALLILLFLQKNKAFLSFKIWIGFLLLAICWLLIHNYTAVLLLAVLALFGFISAKKKKIKFSDEGISYPSFPLKKIKWHEVEQVQLRSGTLSVDLKNNHFMQFVLDPENIDSINEKAFNDFCEERRSL